MARNFSPAPPRYTPAPPRYTPAPPRYTPTPSPSKPSPPPISTPSKPISRGGEGRDTITTPPRGQPERIPIEGTGLSIDLQPPISGGFRPRETIEREQVIKSQLRSGVSPQEISRTLAQTQVRDTRGGSVTFPEFVTEEGKVISREQADILNLQEAQRQRIQPTATEQALGVSLLPSLRDKSVEQVLMRGGFTPYKKKEEVNLFTPAIPGVTSRRKLSTSEQIAFDLSAILTPEKFKKERQSEEEARRSIDISQRGFFLNELLPKGREITLEEEKELIPKAERLGFAGQSTKEGGIVFIPFEQKQKPQDPYADVSKTTQKIFTSIPFQVSILGGNIRTLTGIQEKGGFAGDVATDVGGGIAGNIGFTLGKPIELYRAEGLKGKKEVVVGIGSELKQSGINIGTSAAAVLGLGGLISEKYGGKKTFREGAVTITSFGLQTAAGAGLGKLASPLTGKITKPISKQISRVFTVTDIDEIAFRPGTVKVIPYIKEGSAAEGVAKGKGKQFVEAGFDITVTQKTQLPFKLFGKEIQFGEGTKKTFYRTGTSTKGVDIIVGGITDIQVIPKGKYAGSVIAETTTGRKLKSDITPEQLGSKELGIILEQEGLGVAGASLRDLSKRGKVKVAGTKSLIIGADVPALTKEGLPTPFKRNIIFDVPDKRISIKVGEEILTGKGTGFVGLGESRGRLTFIYDKPIKEGAKITFLSPIEKLRALQKQGIVLGKGKSFFGELRGSTVGMTEFGVKRGKKFIPFGYTKKGEAISRITIDAGMVYDSTLESVKESGFYPKIRSERAYKGQGFLGTSYIIKLPGRGTGRRVLAHELIHTSAPDRGFFGRRILGEENVAKLGEAPASIFGFPQYKPSRTITKKTISSRGRGFVSGIGIEPLPVGKGFSINLGGKQSAPLQRFIKQEVNLADTTVPTQVTFGRGKFGYDPRAKIVRRKTSGLDRGTTSIKFPERTQFQSVQFTRQIKKEQVPYGTKESPGPQQQKLKVIDYNKFLQSNLAQQSLSELGAQQLKATGLGTAERLKTNLIREKLSRQAGLKLQVASPLSVSRTEQKTRTLGGYTQRTIVSPISKTQQRTSLSLIQKESPIYSPVTRTLIQQGQRTIISPIQITIQPQMQITRQELKLIPQQEQILRTTPTTPFSPAFNIPSFGFPPFFPIPYGKGPKTQFGGELFNPRTKSKPYTKLTPTLAETEFGFKAPKGVGRLGIFSGLESARVYRKPKRRRKRR